MNFAERKRMLPEFPRTLHLPHKPNATIDDVVAMETDAKVVFKEEVWVEEKIDGASLGITILNDEPVIRNRDHILNKGFLKNTPAKKQFVPAWNWFYENKEKLQALLSNGTWSVYGEWMVGRHGMSYNKLPDWFIAYDIYDYHHGWFLGPRTARRLLVEHGFSVPPLLFNGHLETPAEVEEYTRHSAEWCEGEVEGVYIRVGDEIVKHRFKMVRADFERGLPEFGDNGKLIKNELAK